jgi:hypothetical protein
MGFYRGPHTVTDGLVLSLDAGNTKSYQSGSTTWFDKSGRGNNGTLTNGPTFSSANGGSIVFDGVDDFVTCGNSSLLQITAGTISAWVKTTSPGSSYRGIIVKQNNCALFVKDSVLITYDWGNSGSDRTTGINIADGNWKYVAMSFTENTGTPLNNANIYLNGNLVLTTTIKLSNNDIGVALAAGSTSVQQNLNGNIAQTSMYNRVLSTAEILQNYNATKSRYNL